MLKIIGIQRKKGTYEGNDYDNIMLHCTETTPYESASSKLLAGYTVERVKVKAHQVNQVFGGLVGCDQDLIALVGSCISVSYDRFQNPVNIRIVDEPSKIPKKGG